MQIDQEISEVPYDVLCDAGVPHHKVVSFFAQVENLLSCNQVDFDGIARLTKKTVNLNAHFPKFREALLSIATNSHKHGDTDTRPDTIIFMSLALVCLEPDAKTIICEFLCFHGLNKIAEALSDNSLHKLSYALAMVDPKYYEYNMQLIFAFLGHYPDAFCAQLPNTPHAQDYTLIRALGNALGSGHISGTVFIVGDEGRDEGRIPSLRDLAQLLLEGMVQLKYD